MITAPDLWPENDDDAFQAALVRQLSARGDQHIVRTIGNDDVVLECSQ
ncbi:MAG: hypothetical protein U0031_12780 [Thermomicrobiales bacterium]